MSGFVDFFLAFFIPMFIIVDPLAGLPVFLAITPHNTADERRRLARRGCLVAFVVVLFFLFAGPLLIGYFGITTPAVRICGGILLFVIGLEMIYGRVSGTETSPRERRLAAAKEDISITPLAIPLLAGPGAIATVLIFAGKAQGATDYLALLLGSAAVFFLSYFFLRQADRLMHWIGILGSTILTRIMGLVLAFLAVQYVIDGISAVWGG
ncbi:MarC family protein [Geoalkalibacter sp.]|uniref:MarC family protein n=1 Tax=Geoalkalibacter sp. TaxID=3041440 RepID=UPI00272E780F|nr:MarC family protein [Geoalkalibacter sp.]